MSTIGYHDPVLLQDCIRFLNIRPKGIYVDATFGGGGHSKAILQMLNPDGRLIAFDQDDEARADFKDLRFQLIRSNFRYLKQQLEFLGIASCDGILADLGVSSHQFDTPERGFSFRFENELDMRMNRQSELTAKRVINTYSADDLIKLFKTTTDLKHIGRLVQKIEMKRLQKPFTTTLDLADFLKLIFNPKNWKQDLAQVFQALRIEVNQELAALSDLLNQSKTLLKPGGRLVILSYHSVEDRMVKNFIKSGNTDGLLKTHPVYGTVSKPFSEPVKNPIQPDVIEINKNPRARSAKLRVAEKTL